MKRQVVTIARLSSPVAFAFAANADCKFKRLESMSSVTTLR
jgi:hypothetical protein